MGQDKIGSFALAGSKTNIMSMAIDHRLREIQDVLNFDLIPQLFELNGWDDTELPTFTYGDLEERDLNEFSSAIQRLMAVGALEFDRPAANLIREAIGLDPKDDQSSIDWSSIPANRTRSGDSFDTSTGGLNGTSDSVSERDNSVSNLENT